MSRTKLFIIQTVSFALFDLICDYVLVGLSWKKQLCNLIWFYKSTQFKDWHYKERYFRDTLDILKRLVTLK